MHLVRDIAPGSLRNVVFELWNRHSDCYSVEGWLGEGKGEEGCSIAVGPVYKREYSRLHMANLKIKKIRSRKAQISNVEAGGSGSGNIATRGTASGPRVESARKLQPQSNSAAREIVCDTTRRARRGFKCKLVRRWSEDHYYYDSLVSRGSANAE